MLRPRIIPFLLVHNRGLVKTINFTNARYVGDTINAVRIFNEKEVDELAIIDIDATVLGREPDYTMIGHWAAECRMPMCYGGGVSSPTQVERIIGLGVEKVAISAAAFTHPDLITQAGRSVGRQSIVVVLDVKKTSYRSGYEIFTHNGLRGTGRCPFDAAAEMEQVGAGEIVVNSIDRDGTMSGLDLELIRRVRARVSIPVTVVGGAGSVADLRSVAMEHGPIGIGAGSLFVFKGALKAVLISYPSRAVRDGIAIVAKADYL